MKTLKLLVGSAAAFLLSLSASSGAMARFIEMREGYFFDPAAGKAWVPHGIAYQTWNRPLGVWQTPEQIDYDLDEMVKMGANSIRVDFVWQHIEEDGDNQWKWENYDYLVEAAEKRGIRIFALIGYQWPPNWFPDEWYTMHPPEIDSEGIAHTNRWQSDIINYEHPEARAQYAEWIATVCGRYKDSKSIVAWIVGNEYGYLGLWSGLLDGYDPWCEQAFRDWTSNTYGTVQAANAAWGTAYGSFSNIVFVDQYRAYGSEGAQWADMVQWREDSIADFTALSAQAAKTADTNHLISYSTVGMQWGEEDWRYHAEDRGKITAAAAARGADVDFFSVNNYPWSVLGHESQNGQWGVSYTKKVAKVPVLYTETGFTSSETMWPGMTELRQGPLIRNALWESLEAGAIGTHIFAWHDRPYITDREKGFGILYANRVIKPSFWVSRNTFNLMDQAGIDGLLRGSQDPRPDIAFLWTAANDSQYNRYECEMQQVAGALERLGYEPNFLDLEDLASGVYTNYRLIILPRNMRVDDAVPGCTNSVLNFLLTRVIPAGVHVMATADLPGMQNPNGRPRAAFEHEVDELFGIDARNAGGYEMPQRRRHYVSWYWQLVGITFNSNAVGPVAGGYHYWPFVWKYSDEIEATSGRVWATLDTYKNRGFESSRTAPVDWDGWWGQAEGRLYITNWAGFALDGTNFAGMWGDAGLYSDFPVVPAGRYAVSTYLRSNAGDPLRDGSAAAIGIEWTDEKGNYLGVSEAPKLAGSTPGDGWVKYTVDAIAPSNAWTARKIIRVRPDNLLSNGAMTGSGSAPAGWSQWNDGSHDPDTAVKLASGGNSWAFWWDGGLWQDVTAGIAAGHTLQFGGWLRTPDTDPLRNGSKSGVIQLEFYNGATLLSATSAAPAVTMTSPTGIWIKAEGSAVVPAGATVARVVVRCDNAAGGDGRFFADDVFLRNPSRGGGGVFVDHKSQSPAVVVKDHGAAKSAIFLYSAGDMRPDGDLDRDPDIYNWKWRYDVFGAVVRDYFGIQPRIRVQGTNAYLCLPEYRTCADGTTLWQVKNYLYETNRPNGGSPQTFTLTSDLFAGKTIRALSQARLLEQNSDGTISLTLDPDGMEVLHVYPFKTNDLTVLLADAPALMHPFGDKNYVVALQYDTLGLSGLTLKLVLMEDGDNGDGVTNEIIASVAMPVAGAGATNFYVYLPDPNTADADYISTDDGGAYKFSVWLEDASGNRIGEASSLGTQVNWGANPKTPPPASLSKGQDVSLPVEWEKLYEYLPWQNTPVARNDAFPSRVAIFRSTKTESFHPGHLDRVNEVCDWLESLGYESGNRLDLSFDNVMVSLGSGTNTAPAPAFTDSVEAGTNGWTASGLWHIAADLAASPTRSWGYNNGVSYNTGAANSGSLTTPWISLSNAAAATLTFRSWYETEDTGTSWDKKLVYVSTDGATWTPVKQVSGANRQWVLQTCDLTAYAGRSIRVRFVFDTVDAVYNAYRGWYIDDISVTVAAGQAVDVFADGMEGTTNWTGSGLWHLTTNRAAAGTTSWVYNDGLDYDTGVRNSGSLVSRWIDLSEAPSATLTFRSWYRTEDTGTSWDRKTVLASADGTNWTQVAQVSGAAEQWTTQTIDLNAFAGRPVMIRFAFDSIDAVYNTFEGWYVDEVRVTTVAGTGVGVFSETAEAGTNGWAASGLWHLADDLSVSPSHSWAYNNGSTYNTGARSAGDLVSPWIDLGQAASATLVFRSWYETEDTATAWDRKVVSATADGTNWTQLAQISGPNRQWTRQTCDLGAYAGQRVRVKFSFDTVDALYNAFKGWYVDNVSVTIVGSDLLFADSFEAGLADWTRAAGAGNWAATGGTARAWRIGNDDNILCAGNAAWSNYTVSADIRYNTQGPYLNDAEVYCRYQDRNNFVKVGIRNFYGFWRLKYTVRAGTNNLAQGWIHEFAKTNRPVENTWYNLKVRAQDSVYTVSFDGREVGSFTATNFVAGRVAIGTKASQLGIWEPQKGYFFIDDDEYSYWSATEGDNASLGRPLNLDWGYLTTFYPTLVLPGTYVMSDGEVSNVAVWIAKGMYSLVATDGGVAMQDETGASKPGRIEDLFGVTPAIGSLAGVTNVTVGADGHYVTLDYAAGSRIPASGTAHPWLGVSGNGRALAMADNGAFSAPALIVNTITNDPWSPKKVFCFNFGVDAGRQLTGSQAAVARRAWEWVLGQAHKVRVLLKYQVHADAPQWDPTVAQWDQWIFGGSGTNNLSLAIPEDGIMTGSNLYWVIYTYPWEGGEPWSAHDGFYTSANDGSGLYASIGGIGLQIFGGPETAFGGRVWDLWMGYNTLGQPMTLTYGIKEKGPLRNEDNFDDQSADGWTVVPEPNSQWTVTTAGVLRATSLPQGGYSMLMRDGLDVADRNITIEYDVKFENRARGGGLVYRGHVLYINPQGIYWSADDPLNLSSGTSSNFSGLVTNADGSVSYVITGSVSIYIGPAGLSTGAWHHVSVNIRDGATNLVSDVMVDGTYVYVMEPLRHTNWTSSSVGFLGPYTNGYCEWDNFRVADEQYSFVHEPVNGLYVPTNATTPFWPFVPDYDPDMWEYDGTALGSAYEWYAYLRGKNAHAGSTVGLYFAPRLMTEDTNFPSVIQAGHTVYVPVEWEQLPQVPMRLHLELVDPYSGATPVSQNFTVTNAAGVSYFGVTVPSNTPSAGSYLWAAYMFPTSAVDPYGERVGLDDTFRFDTLGQPIGPETKITVVGAAPADDSTLRLYSDSGLYAGCGVYVWKGGTTVFNGDYTGITPPEGVKSFLTSGSSWAGWGIFSLDAEMPRPLDLRAFTNGFLKFWLRSTVTLKVGLEDTLGRKREKYIATTGNEWKEITIPISDFGGVDLAHLYGLFEISADTATSFYVDDVRWVKGVFNLYRDAGLPAGADVITWSGDTATFDGDYVDATAPEGLKTFLAQGASWAGWGIAMTNSPIDLRLYSNGSLCFWVKSTTSLKVEVEGPAGTKQTQYIPSTAGAWQEIALPIGSFAGVNLSQVYAPFLISADAGTTFWVDDVRWVRGTNIVVGSAKTLVYSESGIPAGTDVYVWWASQYWSHVTAVLADGGFEESSAGGAFPDSGYWYLSSAGGTATAGCSAAAAMAGVNGLRTRTGIESPSTWTIVYQEYTAYAGDLYRAAVNARQLAGQTWQAGSSAFLQLRFLDAWQQSITSYVSSAKITAAGQAWTLCEIPDTAAPVGTRFVRLELVVQKPGVSGASVADFDNAVLRQANSFNGAFTEDAATPEGTKCFRSYCVNWSGWGIFYTNGTVNLSSYSNGYLKFWLKSSGYTKVELQSISGTATQTVMGASYGPTTNGVGQSVWQQKVIPITNFPGIVLTSIKSPFMVTDPTFDRAYYLDYVRWEMSP